MIPLGDELILEVEVPPTDIAYVIKGQKSVVQLSAFDFAVYGSLEGEVLNVSADTITKEDGSTWYICLVSIPSDGITTMSRQLEILPGMQATVNIVSGSKTILQYLLQPFTNIKNKAFREAVMKPFKFLFILFFTSQTLLSKEYEITVLATNTANFGGIGEWSFSALLESEDEKILFDTGFDENTVLHNAKLLKKDLSVVEKVILSHFHGDHTGGLVKLRETYMDINPKAFSQVYVAEGFFEQRYDAEGNLRGFIGGFNEVDSFLSATQELGINFIIINKPTEISKNLFLSGPVERVYEKWLYHRVFL